MNRTLQFTECLILTAVMLFPASPLHSQERPVISDTAVIEIVIPDDLARRLDSASLSASGRLGCDDTALGAYAAETAVFGLSDGLQEALPSKAWRIAFRTNLLAPALNVGFGVALGRNRRFVLGTEFWYPWFRPLINNRNTCLEGLGWALDGTFFFKREESPYRWACGPYLGLSAAAGYFDYCFDAKGRQGEGAAATLFFGWSFPVNHGRWRLSLDLGGGFLITKYRDYYIWDDGIAYRPGDWEGVLRWWGPTRASVALHIPIWYKR